ncbi:MAG: Rieske 2Fe-2S domain-containing protein [Methanobacterium sp.]|nr:Rieske 2Fe-2S domain-containing protein [Methanobacterium sp.]
MSFVEMIKVGELNDRTMKMVIIDNHEYMLARIGDNYYCSDNRCPHMGGNLSNGQLEGTVVTCPRHHSQFDLKDGHNIRWTDWKGIKLATAKLLKSPRPLKMYDVKIEDGKLMANI